MPGSGTKKLRGVDMDMELGKVQMLPIIASRAYQNTVVVVAMLEIFGLHFLQLKKVTLLYGFAVHS